MNDLPDFLLARIAEDEEVARALLADYGSITGWLERDHDSAAEQVAALDLAPWLSRFDPARVLAECDAKREMVEDLRDELANQHDPEPTTLQLAERTLLSLALPYADHPNYREEWRP